MPANYGFHIEYSETHIVFTLRGRGENGGGQGRLGGGRGWRAGDENHLKELTKTAYTKHSYFIITYFYFLLFSFWKSEHYVKHLKNKDKKQIQNFFVKKSSYPY